MVTCLLNIVQYCIGSFFYVPCIFMLFLWISMISGHGCFKRTRTVRDELLPLYKTLLDSRLSSCSLTTFRVFSLGFNGFHRARWYLSIFFDFHALRGMDAANCSPYLSPCSIPGWLLGVWGLSSHFIDVGWFSRFSLIVINFGGWVLQTDQEARGELLPFQNM